MDSAEVSFEVVERLTISSFPFDDPRIPLDRTCVLPRDWMRGWGNRKHSEILIAVFVRYVNTLPAKRRQESFLDIAIESLETAYPCAAPRGEGDNEQGNRAGDRPADKQLERTRPAQAIELRR